MRTTRELQPSAAMTTPPARHGTATGVPTAQPHDDAVVDDDLVEPGVGCVAEQGSPHNRPGAGRREDPARASAWSPATARLALVATARPTVGRSADRSPKPPAPSSTGGCERSGHLLDAEGPNGGGASRAHPLTAARVANTAT